MAKGDSVVAKLYEIMTDGLRHADERLQKTAVKAEQASEVLRTSSWPPKLAPDDDEDRPTDEHPIVPPPEDEQDDAEKKP